MNVTLPLRDRLNKKDVLIGMFSKMNYPNIVEMIGIAGFDFIVIDTEHSNFSSYDVENLIRAADASNICSIVRVKRVTPEDILHALDSGADGIQVPGITSIEEAKVLGNSSKYYPEGNRGSSVAQRSAMFGMWNKDQKYFKYANDHTAVIMHVENLEIYQQIEELVKLPQLDVIFVGPGDLSQALGKPGQLDDPELQNIINRIFQVALSADKVVGIFCENEIKAKKYIGMGATYITLGSDVSLLGKSLKDMGLHLKDLR